MPWVVTVRCLNGITFELCFYSETDSHAFVAATMEAVGVLSCTVTDNTGKIAAVFNK